MKNIQLATDFSIPALDYAIQGNAILGIKETGKSYTATKIAEGLLDAGIPFIAFDPIGVWKYLRVGKNGDGYPVVVAGRDADLPLTPESIEGIVRAAMHESVPLVLDLYSVLNKSFWRKIVETAVLTLLMENAEHGLRHIFIEEAAEFVPQKLGRSQFDVYSAVESLARMGGNVSLGYTLINQRAEDVNKSVLEICERLILHRQTGKNSLKGIEDWFKISRTEGYEKIMENLPALPTGECWVCARVSHEPTRVKIAEKKTVHPDRRAPKQLAANLATDVSKFVQRLNEALEKEAQKRTAEGDSQTIKQKAKSVTHAPAASMPATDRSQQLLEAERGKNSELEARIQSLSGELTKERAETRRVARAVDEVKKLLKPQYDALRALFEKADELTTSASADVSKYEIWFNSPKMKGLPSKMLRLFIERRRITKIQLGVLTGNKITHGHFRNSLARLTSANLVKRDGDDYILQEID